MVSEEREHAGNLPFNVFPILAEGGTASTILHPLTQTANKKGRSYSRVTIDTV